MKTLYTYICAIFLMSFTLPVLAQNYSSNQVSQFADCLFKWTTTRKAEYRFEAEDLCNGAKKPIVCDEFSHILSKKDNPNAETQESYELETYLNNIEKQVNKGKITISYSGIAKVSQNDIIFNSRASKKDLQKIEFYSCKIKVSGNIQHESNELFYVYDRKIAKIGNYEKKGGKVVVDFDDFINDFETIGFSYNFGMHFPVGASFNYSPEDIPFMISLDIGINLDNDKYIIDKVQMKDIMNYERNKKILNPKFFLTVSPQFHLKYFAIGCGVGFLWMDGSKETASYKYSNANGSFVSSGHSSVTNDAYKIKPMIRPIVKGFIPLRSDELYLSVNVGYDLVFGYKDKNGINVGIGLQWEM